MVFSVSLEGIFCVFDSNNKESGGRKCKIVVDNGGKKWGKGLSPI